jgi:hypothetical protein
MLSFFNYHCFRCDADPAALAKYVFALVKKDKPVAELRTSMVEQLDVFLQSGIFGFLCIFITILSIVFVHAMNLVQVVTSIHSFLYSFSYFSYDML